ncbi:MAG: hypothetical protein P8Y53_18225 [Pseudolabrys sp.]|jgi:hypothetical protein
MRRIIELKTGLFPDAETVAAAIAASAGKVEVVRLDVSGLKPDDREAWERAAEAILAADLTVTL